jgi:hypothetical protein
LNETQYYIPVPVVPATAIIIVLIGVLLNNANPMLVARSSWT